MKRYGETHILGFLRYTTPALGLVAKRYGSVNGKRDLALHLAGGRYH